MDEIVKISSGMLTNEPLLCILIGVIICILIQVVISSIVLSHRRETLVEDYGYNEEQIRGFYWKSVLLFPVTWFLILAQGWKAFWRKVWRR